MAEFGEVVLYKPLKTNTKRNKMEAMWEEGIWVGVNPRTDEALIGTEEGVVKTRSVRCRPLAERWNYDKVMKVQGAPWQLIPNQEKMVEMRVSIDPKVNDAGTQRNMPTTDPSET